MCVVVVFVVRSWPGCTAGTLYVPTNQPSVTTALFVIHCVGDSKPVLASPTCCTMPGLVNFSVIRLLLLHTLAPVGVPIFLYPLEYLFCCRLAFTQ
jgi:hypothetical protein